MTSACPYIHFLYTNVILIHHKDSMQGLSYTYTIFYCFKSGLAYHMLYIANVSLIQLHGYIYLRTSGYVTLLSDVNTFI